MGSGGSSQFKTPQEEIEFLRTQVRGLIDEKEKEMKSFYERELNLLKEEHEKKEKSQAKMKDEYEKTLRGKDEKIEKLETILKEASQNMLLRTEKYQSQVEAVQKEHKEESLRLEANHKKIIDGKDEEIRKLRQDFLTAQQFALAGKDKHLSDVKDFHKRLDEEKSKEIKGKYVVNHTYLVDFPAEAQFSEINSTKIMDSVSENAKATLSKLGANVVKKPVKI